MAPWPKDKDLPIAVIAARKAQEQEKNLKWRQEMLQREIDRRVEALMAAMIPSRTTRRL
jgi:hypothetical protein